MFPKYKLKILYTKPWLLIRKSCIMRLRKWQLRLLLLNIMKGENIVCVSPLQEGKTVNISGTPSC